MLIVDKACSFPDRMMSLLFQGGQVNEGGRLGLLEGDAEIEMLLGRAAWFDYAHHGSPPGVSPAATGRGR